MQYMASTASLGLYSDNSVHFVRYKVSEPSSNTACVTTYTILIDYTCRAFSPMLGQWPLGNSSLASSSFLVACRNTGTYDRCIEKNHSLFKILSLLLQFHIKKGTQSTYRPRTHATLYVPRKGRENFAILCVSAGIFQRYLPQNSGENKMIDMEVKKNINCLKQVSN